MKNLFCALAIVLLFLSSNMTHAAPITVLMETSLGNIELELDKEKAPITVENFLKYANSGFYNGTIFHRVIKNFMIQGGGFTKDMAKKSTNQPIKNESTNGLTNDRGTIAMARTNDPDSATAQFFINSVDNPYLNGSSNKPGYAVFGKVTKGMDVVDKISSVFTRTKNYMQNVPSSPVFINKVSQVNPSK